MNDTRTHDELIMDTLLGVGMYLDQLDRDVHAEQIDKLTHAIKRHTEKMINDESNALDSLPSATGTCLGSTG